ncbi:MAG: hypothetical protein IJ191_07080, partial [Treponema sp.]|nr:hypothetical protein [Treponema sp.]
MKPYVRISALCIAAFSMCLLTAFNTSLDGRAIVANDGELPAGLFAKTVGYLPGDSISITNLVTRRTADVLVIGALDPADGVAIVLSPEAAESLGVSRTVPVTVKMASRKGQLDDVFVGSAVLVGGNERVEQTPPTYDNRDDAVPTAAERGHAVSADERQPDEPFADEAARPDEATVPDDEPFTDEMTVPADEALESDAAGAAATELPFEAEPADDDALENEEAPMAESVPASADEDALPADEYAAPLPDERYSEDVPPDSWEPDE